VLPGKIDHMTATPTLTPTSAPIVHVPAPVERWLATNQPHPEARAVPKPEPRAEYRGRHRGKPTEEDASVQ
jgi:hypothetical protein